MKWGLNKGAWDPKLRGTNIKGTNLKSLIQGINQDVRLEKVEGVMNIGACLKNSNTLLIIWDDNYCQRPWYEPPHFVCKL